MTIMAPKKFRRWLLNGFVDTDSVRLGLNDSNAMATPSCRQNYTGGMFRGPGKRPNVSPHQPIGLVLNVDAMHTAFGLAFTTVWILVGQILVANRSR